MSAILGLPPLVWLGRRSYAVYLWFWPVMMFTRPHRDISLSGPPLVVVQAAITLVLAALSYRLVEKPIRHGALNRVWDDLRQRRRGAADGGGQPVRRATAAWGLAMAVTVGATAVGVAAVGVDSNRSTEVLASSPGAEQEAASRLTASIGGPRRVQLTLPVLPGTTVPPTTVVPPPVDPAAATPSTEATTTTTTAPAVLPIISAKVTAVGDSVLLGAKPLLESQVNGILVDATVGRQFAGVVSSIRAYKDVGQLGELVVVQTGNNGPIAPNQFEELMTVLRDVPKVLVVNVKVDRAWQNVNNEVMSSVVSRTPNAVLIDWHAIATAHPEAFYDDGLHLTAAGIRLFTGAVLAAVAPA